MNRRKRANQRQRQKENMNTGKALGHEKLTAARAIPYSSIIVGATDVAMLDIFDSFDACIFISANSSVVSSGPAVKHALRKKGSASVKLIDHQTSFTERYHKWAEKTAAGVSSSHERAGEEEEEEPRGYVRA